MCLRWTITEQSAERIAMRMSIREIARTFHHSRSKIRRILEQSEPVTPMSDPEPSRTRFGSVPDDHRPDPGR